MLPLKLPEISKLVLECLEEEQEKSLLIEQMDVIRNLKSDPRVEKYIALVSKQLKNVPQDKKAEILSDLLSSLGVDDEYDDLKNRISNKFNSDGEEISSIGSPTDVSPALEEHQK